MTTLAAGPTVTLKPLRRFLKTPKGLLLVAFAPILVLAVEREGAEQALPSLLIITATAALFDVGLYRVLRGRWAAPTGAILTGLILAMVLASNTPAAVEVTTAGIAIVSKHVLRTRFSNVFNPAAVGLVASSLLFDTAQSWWGALPDMGIPAIIVLLVTGVLIADRINKLPLLLAFLGSYVLLFTIASFVLEPAQVAEVFREPDIEALLFFAFFMLDDPPTCPARYGDQVLFGVLVAVGSYALFVANGAVYFLPAGLLLGNGWESARRLVARGRRK